MNLIPDEFLNHASDVLGATNSSFSWTQIAKYFRAKSVELNRTIPYSSDTFPEGLANKRTGLLKNLKAFAPSQQFVLIKELCERYDSTQTQQLKSLLIARYGHLSPLPHHEINAELLEEAKTLLSDYPTAKGPYDSGLQKRRNNIYERNLLDDLRLSLELLLKAILANSKSLENQTADLGQFQKRKGTSTELTSMFIKLLDYYSKYQNDKVKHNDKINSEEVDIIFELTSSFMKFLIKLDKKTT
jgi:hypothetical protein